VVRSDASEAHRLSLSARVLSVEPGQVKAKRHRRSASKRLGRPQNPISLRLSTAAPTWARPPERSAKAAILPG